MRAGKRGKGRGWLLALFLGAGILLGAPPADGFREMLACGLIRFWYPLSAPGERADGFCEGELDPSYREYLERTMLSGEADRLLEILENSRLFSGALGDEAGRQTAAQESALSLGTVAGARLFDSARAPGTLYMEEQLADYDYLMQHFYTVHPTAAAGRDFMKADAFLSADFTLENRGEEGAQILIYHTHSQEEFADFHEGNKEATIVGVGDYLTKLLTERGYRVIHDRSVYDVQDGKLDRSRAYTCALEGITKILEENPSVEVVLDLHRDGVNEDTHLVTELNGKKTAMIMFFNGTSETPDGPVDYLENPCRSENLAFSFQLKLCAEAWYPGFTRKIYLKGLRYNLHVRPRAALIEVGAQNNTYGEAKNAMEPLADLLDMVLGGGH